MKNMNWNDLFIFHHVALAKSLSGAARVLESSPATVGRRVLELEQNLGETLFHRSRSGYQLTKAGEGLHKHVRAMVAATVPLANQFESGQAKQMLRLSAGTGTAMFLADRVSRLVQPDDDFKLTFITTEGVQNINHREIDLGVRNIVAEEKNLASRKLGVLRFAPYRAWGGNRNEHLDWIALDPEFARHKSARWVLDQVALAPVMTTSIATLHQLVLAGAGMGVMPCMIGDVDPGLVRAGPLIEELTETQYLVMHNDDRHRPQMHKLINRIVAVYQKEADLLAGNRAFR